MRSSVLSLPLLSTALILLLQVHQDEATFPIVIGAAAAPVLALTAARVKELGELQADCRPSPPLSIPGCVSQAETLQILVTGSLHLVGAVLGLLHTSR